MVMAALRTFFLLFFMLFFPQVSFGLARLPDLTGWVIDKAELIAPEDEGALAAKLATHNTHTNQQLIVVTMPTIEGEDIDAYAQRLAQHWGLQNGVIIVVAMAERKVRIDVGAGLRPKLTDQQSQYIIEHIMVPAFKQKAYTQGLNQGLKVMTDVLGRGVPAMAVRHNQVPTGRELYGLLALLSGIVGLVLVRFYFGLGDDEEKGTTHANTV